MIYVTFKLDSETRLITYIQTSFAIKTNPNIQKRRLIFLFTRSTPSLNLITFKSQSMLPSSSTHFASLNIS